MPKNQKLNLQQSANSVDIWAPLMPIDAASFHIRLQADTDYVISVPDGYNIAIFSYSAGSSVQVSLDNIALPVSGDIVPVKGSAFMNISQLFVEDGETLHFKSVNDDFIYINFYKN